MALKDIMAISGYTGLYKFVSQGRNGIIVESMSDGKRTHISASAKVSALSDIAIFTHDGEKPLYEILDLIKQKENGGPTISHKSDNEQLKTFFQSLVPNFDTERVYVSDIKKLVAWYNQLQGAGILDFAKEEEEKVEAVAAEKSDSKAEKKAESPKKPAAKKKPLAVDKKVASSKVRAAEPKNVAPKRKTSTNKKSG